MKYIIAIIKPHKLDDVREALSGIDISGMTASEVKGYGRQGGQKEIYRGAEYVVNFVPKVKLEIAATNDQLSGILEAIQSSGQTGQIGDGKLFVLDLQEAIRLRTGETGDDAL